MVATRRGAKLVSAKVEKVALKSVPAEQETPYEILRQQKIAERDALLRSMGILSVRSDIITTHKQKVKAQKVERERKRLARKSASPAGVLRRSERLIHKQPIAYDFENLSNEEKKKLVEKKIVRIKMDNELIRAHAEPLFPQKRPEGDLKACDYYNGDVTVLCETIQKYRTALTNDVQDLRAKSTRNRATKANPSFVWSEDALVGLKLPDWERVKLVKQRAYSIDVHPSTQHGLIVALGDKTGQVGLCCVDPADLAEVPATHSWSPHSRAVNCVKFSANTSGLYSSSFDSTVRLFDLHKETFSEIYRDIDDDLIKYFDVNGANPNVMVVGSHRGYAAIIDLRDIANYSRMELVNARLRTVHFNPANSSCFAVADYDGNASLWDLRYLRFTKTSRKSAVNSPLYLIPHTKGINSAFFSTSGNSMVTCCSDNTINVWDVNSPNTTKIATIKHDNFTGRWLTKFQPEFVPGCDNLVLSGSMQRPTRQVDVISVEDANICHTLDGNSTVCSLVKAHPSMPIVVGANASGYAHIWSDFV